MTLYTNLRAALGLEDNGIDVDINIGGAGSESGSNLEHPMVSATTSTGVMTPEAAEVEVQESAAEVSTAEGEMDDIQKDVSALESYVSILERSLENHGINVVSAEMLNVGLNSILNKYHVAAEELTPGLESYSSNAYATTRVSMEKVKETMQSLKDSVISTLKKFWDAILNFFRNIAIKLIPAVKTRIGLIKKHNESYKPEGGVKIKVTGKTANILSGMKGRVLGEVEQFKRDSQATASQLQKLSKTLEDSIGRDVSLEKLHNEFKSITNAGLLAGGKETKSGSEVVYVKFTQYGNGKHVITYPNVPDLATGLSIKFNEANPSKEPVKEFEIESLKHSDIDRILSDSLLLLSNVEQYGKHISSKSKLSVWIKSLKEDDVKKDQNGKLVNFIKAVGTGFKELNNYILDVVKAVVELCAKSVKATAKKSDGADKK